MSPERAVQQVLAKYVRTADRHDAAAICNLFAAGGKVEVRYANGGNQELIFVLTGYTKITHGISEIMRPHSQGGCSYHTTFDPIIVNREDATCDVQFIRFDTRAVKNLWPGGQRQPGGNGRHSTYGIGLLSSSIAENIPRMENDASETFS